MVSTWFTGSIDIYSPDLFFHILLFPQIIYLIVITVNDVLVPYTGKDSIWINAWDKWLTSFSRYIFPQRKISGVGINGITTFICCALPWKKNICSYMCSHEFVDFDYIVHGFRKRRVTKSSELDSLSEVIHLFLQICSITNRYISGPFYLSRI